MADARWIDVTVEGENLAGTWTRSILAQVWGRPPTTTGRIDAFDDFTAIRLYGVQVTGTDPTNAPDQVALLLTVRRGTQLDDTGIYPERTASGRVRLEWDGHRLRFIVSGHHLDEAIHVDLDVLTPLAPKHHEVVKLRFTYPVPYVKQNAGTDQYIAMFEAVGFDGDVDEARPLPQVFARWNGNELDGKWPVALVPGSSNLVERTYSPDETNIHFSRLLSFVQLGRVTHEYVAYGARVVLGSLDWRQPGKLPPELWPYHLMPHAAVPSQDITCREHTLPWAAGQRAPDSVWLLDVEWTRGPTLSPAAVWNRLIISHFTALETVWAQTGGSVLPVFHADATTAQHWRTAYRVRLAAGAKTYYICDRPRLGVASEFVLEADLSGLRRHDGNPLHRTFKLLPLRTAASVLEADAPDRDDPRLHHIAFEIVDATATESSPSELVRVGSLDLGFSAAPGEALPAGTLMLSGTLADDGIGEPPRICAVDIPLAVGRMIPADQDPTEAEAGRAREGTMLVFDPALARSPTSNKAARWLLTANERTAANHDHTFGFTFEPLQQAAAEPDPRSLIVLADKPFFIAQVAFDPNSLRTGTFGRASLEGPAWKLVDDERPALIRLPPQILGEEMIKNYQQRPYTPDPTRNLRHKLSRTAELRVDRHVLATSAVEPAWNVNRLFGWPKRQVPGSRLTSLKMELLYGLETKLEVPDLRVVEIGASLGELRARQPPRGRGGDASFLAADRRASEQLASRLMYLYIAADKRPYPPAIIEDGVSFRFRPERQVAHPLDPYRSFSIGDRTYWSVKEGGLAGGVDWGFESANIYDEVLDSPTSTSGRLVAPALTALGGFGFQKAGFANDKSRIYSDAALGRTTYYALERIGRIGVLWHPAKHVIVYERTVAASDQFPDHDMARPWRGRPVMRKVREYVELLEDKRSYPDDDSPKATRGAVLAAAFLDRIIPVDSAWGRDIPGGWIVPLYREGADPSVYNVPRVQIQLATSCEPVWKPHDEPHKLVFYTSTNRAHGANPSLWPPAPGVDFPFATIPVVDQGTSAEPPADAQLPDAPAIDSAYEQFTYRLGALPSAIDIAAERGKTAIEAKLHNITLARRSLVEAPKTAVTETWDKARGALATYHADVEAAARKLRKHVDWEAFQTAVDTARGRVETQLGGVSAVITELIRQQNDYLHSWPRGFDEALQAAKLRIEELVREGRSAEVELTAVFNDLGRRLSSIQLIATDLDNRFRAAMRAYALATAQLDALIVDLEKRIADVAKEPARLKQEIVHAVARLTARVQHGVAAAAQLGATSVRGAVEAFLEDIRQRLAEATPDPAKIIASATALRASIDGTISDIENVAKELPVDTAKDVQKALADFLAVESNPLADQAFKDIAAFRARFDTMVRDAQNTVRAHITTANEKIEKIEGAITSVIGEVKSIDASIEKELAAWIALGKQVQGSVPAALDELLATVGDRISQQLAQHRAFVEHTIARIAEQTPGDVAKLGDRAMRFVRAWGETPIASGLAFTRERVAYYFHEGKGLLAVAPRVSFTPVTALVNRLERDIPGLDLHTIGMRLPTFSLDERLIPDLRNALDLSKLFPDIAGLKLDGLFSGVKLPEIQGDGLRVRHGVDRARRSAWVRADVDVRIPPASIFALGPFAMKLQDGRFVADTEVTADAAGGVRRTTHARVSGNWRFEIGGQLVAALEQTKLELDDAGKLRFDVSPKSIRVAEALRMLTQLLQYAPSGAGSGFSIGPVLDGGLPVGVRAALNLALPSLQSGAFSISNLSLASYFQIAVAGSSGFTLTAGLGFATPDRPFNLSVLFLGGGGWFTTAVNWALSGRRDVEVDLGIAAGASLPFDIGVAKGGVWLLLSVGVRWRSGSGGHFSIVLAISLRGEVVILSIVSVSLYLRLEARYISGGNGLECSGYLSLTIKIGWFFKISVRHRVTFTLAGSGGGASAKALVDPLNDYVTSYELDHD